MSFAFFSFFFLDFSFFLSFFSSLKKKEKKKKKKEKMHNMETKGRVSDFNMFVGRVCELKKSKEDDCVFQVRYQTDVLYPTPADSPYAYVKHRTENYRNVNTNTLRGVLRKSPNGGRSEVHLGLVDARAFRVLSKCVPIVQVRKTRQTFYVGRMVVHLDGLYGRDDDYCKIRIALSPGEDPANAIKEIDWLAATLGLCERTNRTYADIVLANGD
jgi:adenylate cyclase class IV